MPFQQDEIQVQIQAKLFDFALTNLVHHHRETFEPLWTVDSWVKFLIWMSLNSGLSGERESLERFADALGPALKVRMRLIFFERILNDSSIRVLADPSELNVLVLPIDQPLNLTDQIVHKALKEIGLEDRVVNDEKLWTSHDSAIAIPWKIVDNSI